MRREEHAWFGLRLAALVSPVGLNLASLGIAAAAFGIAAAFLKWRIHKSDRSQQDKG